MRHQGHYVLFQDGLAVTVVTGHADARRVSPNRAYKRFPTRLAAEEFAAWWNFERERSRAPRHETAETSATA